MIPGEEKGEISNEFFKKLNQQIVQKDNLIKLLQLQIKTLKSQADEAAEGPKKADLEKALEAKEAEVRRLEASLAEGKAELDSRLREKEEQIRSLQQLLEQHQQDQQEALAASAADSRIPELESRITELEGQIEQEKQARAAVEAAGQTADEELQKLKADLETARAAGEEIEKLKADLEAAQTMAAERETLLQTVAGLEQELADAKAKGAELVLTSSPEESTRISELEQDVATLKGLIAEKDEQLSTLLAPGGAVISEVDLQSLKLEINSTKQALHEATARAMRADELEKLIPELENQVAELPELRRKVAMLETDSAGLDEMPLKYAALESERQALQEEVQALKARPSASLDDLAKLSRLNEEFGRRLAQSEEEKTKLRQEIVDLRMNLNMQHDTTVHDPNVRIEIEQLTGQVADQLVAIQKLEGLLTQQKRDLITKDEEIATLKQKVAAAEDSTSVISADSDNQIISGFIDFFDGLDAFLSKNQNPELQSLHRKLLDRLIIPNKIQYMPVVSEIYDTQRHVATDYFRSDKFPEKCIVFEVEKGYRKGDSVIKKSKVWVVQNLYHCASCDALQGNPDSRFCHLCGKKITAPNGLPVDSLPTFEPTATTYLRFAERMIETKQYDKARDYLKEGLAIDPQSVPILLRLADVYAQASEFAESLVLLRQAQAVKEDPRIADRIKQLEVKITIYEQARSLNLSPEEFDKLVNLIQK